MLKQRQILLEETLAFLNALTVSIEFTRADIIKIISVISKNGSVDNLDFLSNCISKIENGCDFPQSWTSSVKAARLYKRDEKLKMLQLGSFLGTSDYKNQVNIINTYISSFKEYSRRADEEYDRRGKLCSLFGVFTGASVFILLF